MRALCLVLGFTLPVTSAHADPPHRFEGPQVGQPAPDFTLSDQQGQPVKLSALKGKVVVLEWTNPQCPFVRRHYDAGTMKTLAERFSKGAVWLAVNSSHFASQADNAAMVKRNQDARSRAYDLARFRQDNLDLPGILQTRLGNLFGTSRRYHCVEVDDAPLRLGDDFLGDDHDIALFQVTAFRIKAKEDRLGDVVPGLDQRNSRYGEHL